MKIVTIVPFDGHLDTKFFNKDIIQIGRTFMKEKKFISEFWTINKNKIIQNFIYKKQKWVGYKSFLNICIKLFKDSSEINLLHLYHISRYSYIMSIIYRLCNPKGYIYIKTDISIKSFNGETILKRNKYLLLLFFHIVNYLGFEDKHILSKIKKRFPKYKNKFYFIPSGAIDIKKIHGKLYKENIISLCGRFGAKEKNYELFLKVLEKYNVSFLKNWKIFFIGDMNSNFSKKIEKLLSIKKELKNIIKIKGFKKEKIELYELLSKSKIFIHTANSEGEPNVQFDAMFCGCYMISTDVGTIKANYTSKFSDLSKINNSLEMYNNIKKNIENINSGGNPNYNGIQKHCINNFTWEKTLTPILDKF